MTQHRKKPVVVEAWQWAGKPLLLGECDAPEWLLAAEIVYGRLEAGQVQVSAELDGSNVQLCIQTLEGCMAAQPGDWIIRGIAGEIYPCKPDIFAATYEAGAWAECFDAQKSIIGFLRETLEQIKRDNQHYNFGSKLVRVIDVALAKVPAPPTEPVGEKDVSVAAGAAPLEAVQPPMPASAAMFVRQDYGATVATIFETDDSIVEVQERNDGVYGLIVHHRRCDRDQWDDLTAYLKPEHFDLLGSVAKRMRGIKRATPIPPKD